MRLVEVIAVSVLVLACNPDSTVPESQRQLVTGTWGGPNAGVIVDDSLAHAHIGCTLGNFRVPVPTHADGSFSVTGEYVLRAYPVMIGPSLPAQFTGSVRNGEMILRVTVNDTVAGRTEHLGPVVVNHGVAPALGPCPICSSVKVGANRMLAAKGYR